jgi:hypothetical protein
MVVFFDGLGNEGGDNMKDAIEVSIVFHEGQRMFAVPKQPAPVQEPVAWQVHPFDYGIGHQGVYARTDRPEQVEMWKRKGWNVQPLYTTPPAAPVQEPVAWVPYLSDRADGVQGHYAIARWNPRGYREVWNLRRHAWGAFSDDVMSLEEADYLLQQITIPTRKPTPPAAQRQWVGLTDDELADIAMQSGAYDEQLLAFARAIEAAHGITAAPEKGQS